MLSQFFISGHLAQKPGVRMFLAIVSLLMCVDFVRLALAPSFAMLEALMIVRRIGEVLDHAAVKVACRA